MTPAEQYMIRPRIHNHLISGRADTYNSIFRGLRYRAAFVGGWVPGTELKVNEEVGCPNCRAPLPHPAVGGSAPENVMDQPCPDVAQDGCFCCAETYLNEEMLTNSR